MPLRSTNGEKEKRRERDRRPARMRSALFFVGNRDHALLAVPARFREFLYRGKRELGGSREQTNPSADMQGNQKQEKQTNFKCVRLLGKVVLFSQHVFYVPLVLSLLVRWSTADRRITELRGVILKVLVRHPTTVHLSTCSLDRTASIPIHDTQGTRRLVWFSGFMLLSIILCKQQRDCRVFIKDDRTKFSFVRREGDVSLNLSQHFSLGAPTLP